jgi:hypothetical protein
MGTGPFVSGTLPRGMSRKITAARKAGPDLKAPDLFGAALERERRLPGDGAKPDISMDEIEAWTREQLGTGISRRALYQVAAGEAYPREEAIVAICEALAALRKRRGEPEGELPHASLARARMLFDERIVGLDAALANLEAVGLDARQLRRMTAQMDGHRVAHQWAPGPAPSDGGRGQRPRRANRPAASS